MLYGRERHVVYKMSSSAQHYPVQQHAAVRSGLFPMASNRLVSGVSQCLFAFNVVCRTPWIQSGRLGADGNRPIDLADDRPEAHSRS